MRYNMDDDGLDMVLFSRTGRPYLGSQLRYIRRELGFSRQTMDEVLEFSKSYYITIETSRRPVKFETVARICLLTSVDILGKSLKESANAIAKYVEDDAARKSIDQDAAFGNYLQPKRRTTKEITRHVNCRLLRCGISDCHKYEDEVWKEMVDCGLYYISNTGRIFSSISDRLISKTPTSRGINRVIVRIDGRSLVRNSHSIVAEAFLGPRPKGFFVYHIDGDRSNDAASNLEYRANSERSGAKKAEGNSKRSKIKRKLTQDQVSKIRELSVSKELTGREIANLFGVTPSYVYLIKNGLRRKGLEA